MADFTDSMTFQNFLDSKIRHNCLELDQNEQTFKLTRQSLDAGYPRKEFGLGQDGFLQMRQSLKGLTDITSLLTAFPET